MADRFGKYVVGGAVVAAGLLPVALASVPPAGATALPPASTTVTLNSWEPSSFNTTRRACRKAWFKSVSPVGTCGGSVTAPVTLVSHQRYRVSVRGTVDAWGSWPHTKCGTPVALSGGTLAGDDAFFRFATPRRGRFRCQIYHGQALRETYFQMSVNGGNKWRTPVPDGAPTAPSSDHTYAFVVTGKGQQPEFRYMDHHPSDNHGSFTIVITPLV